MKATSVGVSWAAAGITLVGPLIAAAWTANREWQFYPAIVLVASTAAAVGLWVHSSGAEWALRLRWLPPPLVVATAFPACMYAALLPGADVTVVDHLRWAAAVVAIGSIAVLIHRRARNPEAAFRRAALVWLASAVLLLPLMGAGLALVPLAVSYWLTSRSLGHLPPA